MSSHFKILSSERVRVNMNDRKYCPRSELSKIYKVVLSKVAFPLFNYISLVIPELFVS
jgi:hypothetical protein